MSKLCIKTLITFGTILIVSNQFSDAYVINKIVGGWNAVKDRWPWQAVLLTKFPADKGFSFCGGTLIHPQWVLTAAYCLSLGTFESLRVGLGIWNVSLAGSQHFTGVIRTDIHPCYNSNDGFQGTNLAMLKLRKRQDPSKMACLPYVHLNARENRGSPDVAILNCFATGYGVTDSGRNADILQETHFPTVSQQRCLPYYRGTYLEDKLCTYGVDARDTCNGDMGGPLVCHARLKACGGFYLAGLTLGGSVNCGSGERPGIYISIQPYIWWIQSIINPGSVGNVNFDACRRHAIPKIAS